MFVSGGGARRGVSPTTACKWWRRWLAASEVDRQSLGCLEDRSSRPHRSPRLLSVAEQELICACRRRIGWGPRLIAGETGHPHATVWRALRRAGISRPAREPREQPRRYEWPCPGDLLHVDTSGSRGSRGQATQSPVIATPPTPRCDAARLSSGCTHSSTITADWPTASCTERAADTVTGFVTRGLAFFASFGITETAHVRQRLDIYPQPPTRPAAGTARHPPSANPVTPTPVNAVERYQQTLKRKHWPDLPVKQHPQTR